MSKVTECEFKMNQLFKRENGCVSENDRGSFLVGRCDRSTNFEGRELYVSFGWNERDEIFVNEKECEKVMLCLLENAYEAYHSEDMNVFINETGNKRYLEYREALPGVLLNKGDAMKLMKISENVIVKMNKCVCMCA